MTVLHFAQISDIHLSTLGNHHDIMAGRVADFLKTALARLNSIQDLDFVLFTGDLFDTASWEEFDRFQQIISALHKPYYVIPGNHDHRPAGSAEGLTHRQFAEFFNPQVKARPPEPETQIGYWSLPVGPGVQLVGLDSIREENWGGIIRAGQIEWLKNELAAHADKLVIMAVHHPFQRLAPIDDDPDWSNFVCDNGPEMLALLDGYPQVGLVLTGHHHLTQANMLGRRLHLACPALVGYPCAYRTLRLTGNAAGTWRLNWSTHAATDEATVARARRRMINAWTEHGFEPAFVEAYARLAQGSESDRNGAAPGLRKI